MGCGASHDDVRPVLYLWPGSAPCRAVVMAARAARVRLRLQYIDLLKGEQHSKKFKKINPNNTVPALVDGKNKVLESHAILFHLMDVHARGAKVYPLNEEKRASIDSWLTYDKETLHDTITSYVYPMVFSGRGPDIEAEAAVRECLHKINMELSIQPYLSGDYVTLSDLVIMADLTLLELKDFDFRRWPFVVKWRNKLKALPYYAASNKGLEDWKFAVMVKETGECSDDKPKEGNHDNNGSDMKK